MQALWRNRPLTPWWAPLQSLLATNCHWWWYSQATVRGSPRWTQRSLSRLRNGDWFSVWHPDWCLLCCWKVLLVPLLCLVFSVWVDIQARSSITYIWKPLEDFRNNFLKHFTKPIKYTLFCSIFTLNSKTDFMKVSHQSRKFKIATCF